MGKGERWGLGRKLGRVRYGYAKKGDICSLYYKIDGWLEDSGSKRCLCALYAYYILKHLSINQHSLSVPAPGLGSVIVIVAIYILTPPLLLPPLSHKAGGETEGQRVNE